MRIGIVGAGIMGRLLAFRLCQAGHDITIFDGGSVNSSSQTAAGLLTPFSELEKNDVSILELGREALDRHWPIILNQLPRPVYFQKKGSLVLSHAKDESDLQRFVQIIYHKLKSESHFQKLNQQEITQYEPAIQHFNQGHYFPSEGQIDSQQVLIALQDYLRKNKVKWLANQFVTKCKPHAIWVEKEKYQFDWVMDCRGLGAKSAFSNLRGVRGELIWLQAPDITITRPVRLLHPRYRLYLVPRPDHIYIVGASEIESEDKTPISVRTTLELLTAVYSLHPHFCEAKIIKTATECRPTLVDHLPKIQYSPGLIGVNGLYRHGFLIAPTLAHVIAQGLENGFTHLSYQALWERNDD